MTGGEQYYIYILTNRRRTVLYIGVTSHLKRRIYEHKMKWVDGFSKRYNLDCLIYYEIADHPLAAIEREKQLKAGSRIQKEKLINQMNPQWKDLSCDL